MDGARNSPAKQRYVSPMTEKIVELDEQQTALVAKQAQDILNKNNELTELKRKVERIERENVSLKSKVVELNSSSGERLSDEQQYNELISELEEALEDNGKLRAGIVALVKKLGLEASGSR